MRWVVASAAKAVEPLQVGMPMAPSGSPKLDFLRTCAVLSVVVSHLWFKQSAIARFGRFGVLLFFVHTSLVLMFSLERQVAANGARRLWTVFMVRRVFRIYPLCLVVLFSIYLFRIPAYVMGDGLVNDIIPIDWDSCSTSFWCRKCFSASLGSAR